MSAHASAIEAQTDTAENETASRDDVLAQRGDTATPLERP